jgi:hypothetical protein
MESFSQRNGFKPIKNSLQINSMDNDLKTGLWNAFYEVYVLKCNDEFHDFLKERIWVEYFKYPRDEFVRYPEEYYRDECYDQIRNHFLDLEDDEFYEICDLMEFIVHVYPVDAVNEAFMDKCNETLKKELSVYRFVGRKITKITSETEIDEIEEALDGSPKPISIHLENSLDLLSDRKSPDYRNSIKESISAVESICKMITEEPKGTLGRCLNRIGNKVELHPDLRDAFKNLYGYTSDSNGIRHALMDEPNLDFEDAKFMLVSCSAFINYLISKASKSGIDLKM